MMAMINIIEDRKDWKKGFLSDNYPKQAQFNAVVNQIDKDGPGGGI
jgi:hypothetical protein